MDDHIRELDEEYSLQELSIYFAALCAEYGPNTRVKFDAGTYQSTELVLVVPRTDK